jgi:hypothetical protein
MSLRIDISTLNESKALDAITEAPRTDLSATV